MNYIFEKIIDFTLGHEVLPGPNGHRSNVSGDPGGRTVWGISERYHPQVVARLWDMSREESRIEAVEFYRVEYWDKLWNDIPAVMIYDSIPPPVQAFLFDSLVNPGARFTIPWRDKFLYERPRPWLSDLIAARIQYYLNRVQESPGKIKFLRGWCQRVVDLVYICLKMK